MIANVVCRAAAAAILISHVSAFLNPGIMNHHAIKSAALSGRIQLPAISKRQCICAVRSLRDQIKFADAVAETIKLKFKGSNMDRVLDSWYRMEDDYVYKERVEEFDTWQEANSYIRGLPIKPFYEAYDYAWARGLRDNAKIIQDEFQRVAIKGADDLQERGNNVWIGAANATSYAAYGGDWKTLALMDRCVWDDTNVELFPETTRILRELQVRPTHSRSTMPVLCSILIS
jgi:hypothetical protein